MTTVLVHYKGSSKSGNYGHAGRRGKVGGSAPKSAAPVFREFDNSIERDALLASIYPEKANGCPEDNVECKAYDNYTDGRYRHMNELLRSGKPYYSEIYKEEDARRDIQYIDNLMKAHTVPESIVVYRGAVMPSTAFKQCNPGDEFEDKGFVSTSLAKYTADAFCTEEAAAYRRDSYRVSMTIRVPKGSHALGCVGMGESELTLPRGSKFRVLDVSVDYNGVRNMELELIQ